MKYISDNKNEIIDFIEAFSTKKVEEIITRELSKNISSFTQPMLINELVGVMNTNFSLAKNSLDGALYVWSNVGKYIKASVILPTLLKKLCDIFEIHWSTRIEREVLTSVDRDCIKSFNGFNNDNLVNLKNGVFDLNKGKFRIRIPNIDFFDYILDYNYNSKASCPQFIKFINETFNSDTELITTVQEILGYCLSTDTKLQKVFFFYGKGCNGKSVLSNVMRELIGISNTSAISLSELSEQFGLEGLISKRLNISGENESLVSTQQIKGLVGEDLMNIQRKHKTSLTLKLSAKYVFLLNNLPESDDSSFGFYRRIVIVPFENTIKEKNADPELSNKLLNEISGIFNWCVEGYKRLKANGYNLTYSTKIKDYNELYALKLNTVLSFYNNHLEKDDKSKVLKSTVYNKYEMFCSENSTKKLTKKEFFNKLNELTVDGENIVIQYRKNGGYMYLIGYRLVD